MTPLEALENIKRVLTKRAREDLLLEVSLLEEALKKTRTSTRAVHLRWRDSGDVKEVDLEEAAKLLGVGTNTLQVYLSKAKGKPVPRLINGDVVLVSRARRYGPATKE